MYEFALVQGGEDLYGVATISRLLKIIGLFCKRALSKRLNSAKETHNLKEPTNRSHPIVCIVLQVITFCCRSFSAKESLITGLFDEMTYKEKAFYVSSPPCTS